MVCNHTSASGFNIICCRFDGLIFLRTFAEIYCRSVSYQANFVANLLLEDNEKDNKNLWHRDKRGKGNFVAHNANVAHGNEIDCNNKT